VSTKYKNAQTNVKKIGMATPQVFQENDLPPIIEPWQNAKPKEHKENRNR